MTQFIWANVAATTLADPVLTSDLTVTLLSGTGALFPSPGAGQAFALVLRNASNATIYEVTYCTSRTGDICTVTRAQEGTSATAFSAGDLAGNLVTEGTLGALGQWQAGAVTSIAGGSVAGNVLTIAPAFQTVSNEIASRALGTTYTNTTGKAMFVCVEVTSTGTNNDVSIAVDGNIICVQQVQGTGDAMSIYAMVPAGSTYEATDSSPGGGSISLSRWTETS